MMHARHSLSMIFSTLRFLAVQGLAIRGKNDESSNFPQLLHLRAQDSAQMVISAPEV